MQDLYALPNLNFDYSFIIGESKGYCSEREQISFVFHGYFKKGFNLRTMTLTAESQSVERK